MSVSPPLPPLPKIEGDVELLLDVFTHSSLRMSGAPLNDDYGDTDRLAVLGANVLYTVVATHWFHSKNPSLKADELNEKIKESLSETTVDSWMNAYGLKSKLRIAPSEMQSVIDSSKSMRKVFETYVGAVYFRNANGFREIQKWISSLIDPTGASATLEGIPDHSRTPVPPLRSVPPPAPNYSRYATPVAAPPPPKSPPPPMPGVKSNTSPFGFGNTVYGMQGHGMPMQGHGMHGHVGSPLSMVSVALLNQKAVQNGYQATYPAEHSGPPHAPTWNVKCCLNGKEYGHGSGKSQKVAKEEAARMAWAAMGW